MLTSTKRLVYNGIVKNKTKGEHKKMAQRRMLNISVIESDRFCTMSPSAQTLYIHLVMNADDDGFVDMWKSLLRYLSIKKTHVDTLEREGYIIIFNDGVMLITDWLLHNKIRPDRYKAGLYKDRLDHDLILENGRYFKAS